MNKDTQEAAFRQRVLEYQRNGHSVTDTANRYHLSRKTVHKWRNRWDGTRESLEDRSRRPKNSPREQTEAEIKLVKRQAKKRKWQDIILAYTALFSKSCNWNNINTGIFVKPGILSCTDNNSHKCRIGVFGSRIQSNFLFQASE